MVYIEKNGFNEIFQYIVDKLENYQNQMSFMYISIALKSNKSESNWLYFSCKCIIRHIFSN